MSVTLFGLPVAATEIGRYARDCAGPDGAWKHYENHEYARDGRIKT